MSRRILVVGAGGVMGGRVAALLEGHAAFEVVRASRRGEAALGPGARVLDVREPRTADALDDVFLLVNAVGPYHYDPAPLVAACIEARTHYVDLAEDVDFLGAVERAAAAHRAHAAGIVVAGGASTVPGLLRLVASPWLLDPAVARIDAWLSMGTRNEVARGLLFGLLRPLGRRAPDGERYFGRVVRRRFAGRSLRFGRYPTALPGDALPGGDRRVPARFHAGFDRAGVVHALRAAALVLPALSDRVLRGVVVLALPFVGAVRSLGTPLGLLRVEAVSADGSVAHELEIAASRDGLDIPAAPALWVAEALVEQPELAGPRSLDAVVDRTAALGWLERRGFEVRER